MIIYYPISIYIIGDYHNPISGNHMESLKSGLASAQLCEAEIMSTPARMLSDA